MQSDGRLYHGLQGGSLDTAHSHSVCLFMQWYYMVYLSSDLPDFHNSSFPNRHPLPVTAHLLSNVHRLEGKELANSPFRPGFLWGFPSVHPEASITTLNSTAVPEVCPVSRAWSFTPSLVLLQN